MAYEPLNELFFKSSKYKKNYKAFKFCVKLKYVKLYLNHELPIKPNLVLQIKQKKS